MLPNSSDRRTAAAERRHSHRDEAVRHLTGRIAHDFNNLLTAIRANTQFALRELHPGSAAYESIVEIGRAADRAAALTSRLQTLSRTSALHPRAIEVDRVVADSRSLVQRVAGLDVRVEVSLSAPGAFVMADPVLFEQTLVELAIHARDAGPARARLLVRTEPQSMPLAEGGGILIGITTGDATPVALPAAAASADDVGDAVPLLVDVLARESGGSAWLDTTDAGAPTAWLALPLFTPRPADGDATARSSDAPDGVPAPPNRPTLLLVEDDDVTRAVAERMLREAGHDVVTARNGREALARWVAQRTRGARIDGVVADVVMPELDGRELVRRLREDRATLPCIFISGYAHADLPNEVGGPTAFVGKPFGSDELLSAVRRLLAPTAPSRPA
jgi:two-component system cell cycle sensor histidine kinase/response regulator CckA